MTLIVLLKTYSDNVTHMERGPWIDLESRKVLEDLDPKLVHVLDKLFDHPDYMSYYIKRRIERRLYLFPFMTHDKSNQTRVFSIVESVLRNMYPGTRTDTLNSEWAMNRYDRYPQTRYER